MYRVLLVLAALGFLAASLSWLAGARRAYHRARVVEHRGLEAAQWRSIGAKDALAGVLFLSLVPGLAAAAIQGQTSIAALLLVIGVVPALLSLVWIRRFTRLAGLIEAEADYAQRQRERTGQETELAVRVAARLGAESVATPGGILLRTLYHPAEGLVGGDFLGTATAGEDVVFVVGDVTGHGLDAAIQALRLKDLLLAAVLAGQSFSDALALANAHLSADPSGESLATVFLARYHDGVLHYANAGHLPGHLFNGATDQPLPPTGPLLGLVSQPGIAERAVPLAPGFRVVVYTDGLIEAYGKLGGLDDEEVVELVRRGEFALLHERLNARRPEPLRDDIAAIEFVLPTAGSPPA
jgi:Stage II sporulation protein E (SpoIIE)